MMGHWDVDNMLFLNLYIGYMVSASESLLSFILKVCVILWIYTSNLLELKGYF